LRKAGVAFQCLEQAVAGVVVEHGVRSANEQRAFKQLQPEDVKQEDKHQDARCKGLEASPEGGFLEPFTLSLAP
jgi:hypothetical protein